MKSELAEIVFQNIQFFSLAPDSELQPDAAVRQLEIVASILRNVPDAEIAWFCEEAAHRAEELRTQGVVDGRVEILENLREHLGI